MKKYKHIQSRVIATEKEDGNVYFTLKKERFILPKELIKNSSDWREVTKTPLFKTLDKVEIFEGDTFYYIPESKSSIYLQRANGKQDHKITFSSKEAAQEYLKYNGIKYSLKNVLDIIKKFSLSPIKEEEIINSIR